MAKTSGFARFQCDRCKKEAFLLESDFTTSQWKSISRVSADGVQQSYLLCPDCAAKYRELARKRDEEFAQFMVKEG